MACNHERIKSVNCVISCVLCGEILPADFLTGKHPHEGQKAAETPENAVKTEAKKTTRKKTK